MEARSHAVGSFSSTLEAARRGDPAARARLYEDYRRHVEIVVRRRLPQALRARYDTMDFAQSVFAEVLRDLPRIDDRGERAFIALLRLKAVNKLRRRMKRDLGRDGKRIAARLPSDVERTTSGDAAAVASAREEGAKLQRLVADLEPTAREILRLRTEGRTFEEIASALRLASAEAARKRHDRGLVQLRGLWDVVAPAVARRKPRGGGR